ncbi:phosphoglycerate kinase [Intestinimonas butyriciproducens]|uniref:phosphoglycerate kinase n=1 Tax=Intestinimonas butyriciproducens TaxID=1297617 RepID=UPI00195CA228|nr:phosphoglycerate kinase [Intestinimonas butyriciproducens]MBM6917811.1 phosphoglycerate kinase [Intestinimonas butyriciproducens]
MNFNKKTVRDIDVRGKKVLIRCDFNTPIDENGHLTDERRIQGALPTLRYLITSGAAVIVVSHLGRPKGQYNPKYTLKPVANRLSELLKMPVTLATDVIGEDADRLCAAIQPGEIVMLENVRFHKEEEKNDPAFSQKLASYADVYVNDAFGTSHRAHSSTAGVAAYLPAVCGFLIEKEISVIGKALTNPARPFVAITGGAKVSDKIGVINALIDQCDTVIIGGAMSYTFLRALSGQVGNSPCELDKLDVAADIITRALEGDVRLVLPDDVVVTKEFAPDADAYVVDARHMPDGMGGMDMGPRTIEKFKRYLKDAGTVVWNGPLGVFEFDKFAGSTREIARAVAESGAVSIIGGGDSAAAIEQLGFSDRVTHISTGGGASLELIEGKVLPGIACLMDSDE